MRTKEKKQLRRSAPQRRVIDTAAGAGAYSTKLKDGTSPGAHHGGHGGFMGGKGKAGNRTNKKKKV
jgi:hypothetical protein